MLCTTTKMTTVYLTGELMETFFSSPPILLTPKETEAALTDHPGGGATARGADDRVRRLQGDGPAHPGLHQGAEGAATGGLQPT